MHGIDPMVRDLVEKWLDKTPKLKPSTLINLLNQSMTRGEIKPVQMPTLDKLRRLKIRLQQRNMANSNPAKRPLEQPTTTAEYDDNYDDNDGEEDDDADEAGDDSDLGNNGENSMPLRTEDSQIVEAGSSLNATANNNNKNNQHEMNNKEPEEDNDESFSDDDDDDDEEEDEFEENTNGNTNLNDEFKAAFKNAVDSLSGSINMCQSALNWLTWIQR